MAESVSMLPVRVAFAVDCESALRLPRRPRIAPRRAAPPQAAVGDTTRHDAPVPCPTVGLASWLRRRRRHSRCAARDMTHACDCLRATHPAIGGARVERQETASSPRQRAPRPAQQPGRSVWTRECVAGQSCWKGGLGGGRAGGRAGARDAVAHRRADYSMPRSDRLTRPPRPTVTGNPPTTSSLVMFGRPRSTTASHKPSPAPLSVFEEADRLKINGKPAFRARAEYIARGAGRFLSTADVQRFDEVLVEAVGQQERDRLVAIARRKIDRAAAKKAAASAAPSASSFDDNGPTDGGSGAEEEEEPAGPATGSTNSFDGNGPTDGGSGAEEEEEPAGPATGSTNSFDGNGPTDGGSGAEDNGSTPRTATKGKRGEAARLGFDNAGDAWNSRANKRVGVQTDRLDPGADASVQTKGDEIPSVRAPPERARRGSRKLTAAPSPPDALRAGLRHRPPALGAAV